MDIWSYGTPTGRRERALAAVRHEETDYVPFNFHSIPMVYHKICDHYGLKNSEEVADFLGNHVVKIGTDFNYNPWASEIKQLDLTPSGGPVHTNLDAAGELHMDEFGCVGDRSAGMPHPVAYPLADSPESWTCTSFPILFVRAASIRRGAGRPLARPGVYLRQAGDGALRARLEHPQHARVDGGHETPSGFRTRARLIASSTSGICRSSTSRSTSASTAFTSPTIGAPPPG